MVLALRPVRLRTRSRASSCDVTCANTSRTSSSSQYRQSIRCLSLPRVAKAIMSWDYYLGSDYRRGGDDVPYLAAPSRAEDLSGLPPAHVTTMEFDPLRDEGVLYALKLLQSGVSTELHSYPGTFHGSSLIPTAAVSQREGEEMLVALRRGLKIQNNDS